MAALAKPTTGIASGLVVAIFPKIAAAQAIGGSGAIGATDIVLLSALVGTVSFAVISAISLIRVRNRTETENARLVQENANLRAAADRAESLINIDDQRLVVWEQPGKRPSVVGSLPAVDGVPTDRSAFVAFGAWLDAGSAGQLDGAIGRLRERGEGFSLALATAEETMIEAVGRTVGGRAVVRFRDLTGDRLKLASLSSAHRNAAAELGALKSALEAANLPCWVRDRDGRLIWVNRAYSEMVERDDPSSVIASSTEFIDESGRNAIAKTHQTDPVFRQRLSVVAAGNRPLFDVTDVAIADGSAGIATDVTQIEESESALGQVIEFHNRTLDQLATAVAVFGPDRRLRSYNAAYRALFGLDASFLDSLPEEGQILDQLRATRKIPEQADFRGWKAELLSAYQSIEAREYLWHLPEGLTLRVIANPHPQGGVIWIYENVTERLDLESRYNALIRVQGETLDHLREGVAVFGSDGRLKLHNPAFVFIWGLDEAHLRIRSHISDIVTSCSGLLNDDSEWNALTASIAGVDEGRATVADRMERRDGRIVDYATVPLPEGQTMVTFVDITDTVQVERALVDRNDALEAADRLKNEFIQHISYELRSPLTNIIGFSQLISDVNVGPLNDRQREYIGYVMTSSRSLLTIINDILDLATIDAGIIELDLARVELAAAVDAAIDGLRDRIHEKGLTVDRQIAKDVGTLVADEKRLRQILFNLLSNAIGFSPQGGQVSVTAKRERDDITLVVDDEGVGIPDEFIGAVFDRFESRPAGSARGGVGLGLAIVKSFVELHGGTVTIRSRPSNGTTVRVTLPIQPQPIGIAAE